MLSIMSWCHLRKYKWKIPQIRLNLGMAFWGVEIYIRYIQYNDKISWDALWDNITYHNIQRKDEIISSSWRLPYWHWMHWGLSTRDCHHTWHFFSRTRSPSSPIPTHAHINRWNGSKYDGCFLLIHSIKPTYIKTALRCYNISSLIFNTEAPVLTELTQILIYWVFSKN